MSSNNGFFPVPVPCMWNRPDGSHCDYLFFAHELSAHLREYHGIRGRDKLRVYCCWNGCHKELNKESLSRHVEEKHLMIMYPCDTCNKTFTREYNLRGHKERCPAQEQ